MTAAGRDSAITLDRRRRMVGGALYALACLVPAGTFAAFIVYAWRAQ